MKNRILATPLLTLAFIVLATIVNSQELKVSDYKIAPLDISARENVVYDPNGDACAIIKTRTGIQDIKFSSDLEIIRAEFRNGEYWIWVPPGTRKISMEAPDFPMIEFTLPEYTEKFNVYIIFLSAVLPERTLYRPPRTVSFDSKPSHAEVFINDIYFGSTPLTMNIPFDVFKYRIQLKTYLTETASDTITDKPQSHFCKLRKDPKGTRFYALTTAGMTLKDNNFLWGFNVGTLGKFGSSLSVNMYNPGSEDSGYLRFALGINPRLNPNIFLSTGLGLSTTGLGESNSLINVGLIFRTNKRVLINISSNIIFGQSHLDESGHQATKHIIYDSTDLNFGIGYNF
jgi:hypothetical protein